MADNTESVARHYNRVTAFHGAGHTPAAIAPEPAELIPEVAMTQLMIDNLKPAPRAAVLSRLREMGQTGDAPDGAENAEVVFEVSGGAPGERYVYRLGVRGDGTAERRTVDETQPGEDAEVTRGIDRQLASRAFAAAAEVGLLDDTAPAIPQQHGGEILPDSMIAIFTVRDGDSVRRIAIPADDPATANLPGETRDVPMDTPVQLPAESVAALGPLLEALQAVEAAL
jgi:hypothetical protein